MRITRRAIESLSAILLCLGCAGVASAATIEFSGSRATFNGAPAAPNPARCGTPAPPLLYIDIPSGLGSSNLGAFQHNDDHCVNVATGSVFDGLFNWDFGNGDTLFGTFLGTVQLPPVNGIAESLQTYTITGGTGSFLNSTGSLLASGTISFNPDGTGNSQFDFRGTITTVPEPATWWLLGIGVAGIMLLRRRHMAGRLRYWAAACAAALLPSISAAAILELQYDGSFSANESLIGSNGVDLITATTVFQVRARFDTASPDLSIPPLPGWVSYAPISATIVIGGVSYSIVGHTEDPVFGPTVNVFDRSNIFTPNFYGVGLFSNPIEDGAGFVADFDAANPEFSVDNLVPTEFVGYNGAGFLSGVGCFPLGNPACTFQPWTLRDASGAEYALGFFSRQEEVRDGAPLATVRIVAVPEPGTLGLLAAGLLGLVGLVRRRSVS